MLFEQIVYIPCNKITKKNLGCEHKAYHYIQQHIYTYTEFYLYT